MIGKDNKEIRRPVEQTLWRTGPRRRSHLIEPIRAADGIQEQQSWRAAAMRGVWPTEEGREVE